MIKENKVAFISDQRSKSRRTIGRTTTGTNISNKHTNVGDVSRSQDETNVININGTNPKSTSILLPLPIFENSKFPVEKRANRSSTWVWFKDTWIESTAWGDKWWNENGTSRFETTETKRWIRNKENIKKYKKIKKIKKKSNVKVCKLKKLKNIKFKNRNKLK